MIHRSRGGDPSVSSSAIFVQQRRERAKPGANRWPTRLARCRLRTEVMTAESVPLIVVQDPGARPERSTRFGPLSKLTVNEAKTRPCRVPEESFDFLGYTIGLCHSPRTGR